MQKEKVVQKEEEPPASLADEILKRMTDADNEELQKALPNVLLELTNVKPIDPSQDASQLISPNFPVSQS